MRRPITAAADQLPPSDCESDKADHHSYRLPNLSPAHAAILEPVHRLDARGGDVRIVNPQEVRPEAALAPAGDMASNNGEVSGSREQCFWRESFGVHEHLQVIPGLLPSEAAEAPIRATQLCFHQSAGPSADANDLFVRTRRRSRDLLLDAARVQRNDLDTSRRNDLSKGGGVRIDGRVPHCEVPRTVV